jgi:uncharacterized integral membrane protein (TIGR02327 family)
MLFEAIGQQALLNILVHLMFVGITWWALQAVRIQTLIKKGNIIQARLILILLTIAISSLVSNFFLNYLNWALQLRYMF